jgi:PCFT/HCP family folate transporter-like MFS transporter 1/3
MDNPGYENQETPYHAEADDRRDNFKVPKVGKFKRALQFMKQLVIEPIIFFHPTVLLMTQLVAEDLMLDRACRVNLNYPTVICNALADRDVGNYTLEEEKAQKVMSAIATWRSVLEYAVPSLIVLLLGSWSGRYGQRLPFLITQVGTLFRIVGILVGTYVKELDSNWLAIIFTVPSALTGSFPLFSLAFHSYIAVSSSDKTRTARFVIANVVQALGVSAGWWAGGFLLTGLRLGHAGAFMVAGALEACVLAYTLAFVRSGKGGVSSIEGTYRYVMLYRMQFFVKCYAKNRISRIRNTSLKQIKFGLDFKTN